MTRRIIPDSFMRNKPHAEQLRQQANDILQAMANSINDPKAYKTYAESFTIVSKLLGDELNTEHRKQEVPVDISGFDE